MDVSWVCMFSLPSKRNFRPRIASAKAVATASSWSCPRQLFHNAQNHARIAHVAAASRSDAPAAARPARGPDIDLREIDTLATASGAAKASALGRKYSKRVIGVIRLRMLPSASQCSAHTHALADLWRRTGQRPCLAVAPSTLRSRPQSTSSFTDRI
jgi:hypothetical protein